MKKTNIAAATSPPSPASPTLPPFTYVHLLYTHTCYNTNKIGCWNAQKVVMCIPNSLQIQIIP